MVILVAGLNPGSLADSQGYAAAPLDGEVRALGFGHRKRFVEKDEASGGCAEDAESAAQRHGPLNRKRRDAVRVRGVIAGDQALTVNLTVVTKGSAPSLHHHDGHHLNTP